MMQLVLPGGGLNINDPLQSPDPSLAGSRIIRDYSSIGAIISSIVPVIFAIAGIILFVMFIMAGFTLLTAGGSADKIKQGSAMMTSALIGFVIIFLAYWIMQIIQIIFGVKLGF